MAVSSEGATLAAAVQRQLRGVRQRVQTVVSAQECARERATRKRSRFQSASVCVCGHRGVCSRPRTNATVIGQSLLASPDQRRNSWCVCSRHVDQRIFGVRMRVAHQRAAQSAPGPGPGRVCLKQERRVKRHGGGRRVFMTGMRKNPGTGQGGRPSHGLREKASSGARIVKDSAGGL